MHVIKELNNPVYANEEETMIDCVIVFQDELSGELLDPMPYSANKFDEEQQGADLYQALINKEFGEVAAFPIPTLDMIKVNLSYIRQGKQDAGIIVNGLDISTSKNARQEMRHYLDELEIVYWKLPSGSFHQYSSEEFKKVYHAVVEYVNDCFARESELISILESSESPNEIDLHQGFPLREITV